MQATQPPVAPWRQKLQTLFFEPDTFRGRVFDKALIATIVLSTTVIILESVPGIRRQHGNVLGCYAGRPENNSRQCPACQESGDTEDARFCKHCGQALPENRKS